MLSKRVEWPAGSPRLSSFDQAHSKPVPPDKPSSSSGSILSGHRRTLLGNNQRYAETGDAVAAVNSVKAMKRKVGELSGELNALSAFSREEFIEIIRDVGFSCTLCGRCCTREFNDHVFLLDDDVDTVRQTDPGALIPAPYYQLCDRQGNFYVSGYALRCKPNGDCLFLENNRCRVYDRRFRICRIYPYMLHREEGRDGTTDWRQISGINEHGEYHQALAAAECEAIADETIQYEKDFLEKEIAFYTFCAAYFENNGLRPVRKVYDKQMREFEKGRPVTVFVFDGGRLHEHTVCKEDYQPSAPQGEWSG